MNETVETHLLAGIGLTKGVFELAKGEMTAEKAWLGLGAAILAYEVVCPQNQLLSEGVDRSLEKHPLATKALIGVTALHLANVLPERIDPFSWGVKAIRRGK